MVCEWYTEHFKWNQIRWNKKLPVVLIFAAPKLIDWWNSANLCISLHLMTPFFLLAHTVFFFIAHWIDDSKCFNDAFGHCCYSYTIQFRGMKWGKMLFDYVKFQYFAEIKLLKLFCLCWNKKMSHIKMNLWLKIQLKPRRFMRQKRIVDDGGRISRALIEWLFGAFHVYQYLRLILRNWMLLMRMYENKR